MPNQSVIYKEYKESLNCLITLREQYDIFLIGGDFNMDLHKSSLHQKSMQSFLLQQNLSSGHNLRYCEINYTFESKSNSCKSLLDFFVFNIPFCDIADCNVLYEGDNFSDHFPVRFVMNLPVAYHNEELEN